METFAGAMEDFGDPSEFEPVDALDRALSRFALRPSGARDTAQECSIHRWDAAQAFGVAYSVEPGLACDSIPSFFVDAWPLLLDYLKRPAGHGETLHLHRTDGEG